MPKNNEDPRSNSELTEAEKLSLQEETAKYHGLQTQRDNINAKMNSCRKTIKALGINLDAWRASLKRQAMDPEKRTEFDRSAEECNKAFGIPVQQDLFEAE